MRVDARCCDETLDAVVPTLPVATGLVFPLALVFEALVAGHISGDVLRASLDPLPGGRRFFGEVAVVFARLRIIGTIDVIKLAHLCLLMRAASRPLRAI